MFKNFSKNLINFLLPTIILLVVGFLAWKNYEPGTILAGWDSLHPEFNFTLAIKRVFFGVWRPEQGVGAIAAHAHMADLPRILILWVSSIFLSTQFLRYFYILICLLIGPLGTYFFLKHLFERKQKGILSALPAFLGAFYYLLNLGTMQNFILPFEMFNTQYAVLPWIFLFLIRILDEGKKKNYLIFFLLSILATPMAYASALFYAYLGGVGIFTFIYWLIGKEKKNTIKRAFLILGIIFATNAFWILPNIYSIKNQSETISNSKINSLFSPEAFLRNKDYGSLSNILIHKGFLFSWRAYDFSKGEYVDLLDAWNKHLSDPFIANLGLVFGIVCIFGVILSFIKRDKIGVSFFALGLFSVFFLINDNFPTSSIYKFLYDNFAVFREGYRMPFTKFSILFMFSMSYFFGFFFYRLFSSISKKRVLNLLSLLISSLTVVGLCIFMLPAFNGQLISSVVKNKIPNEYFEVYKYLNGKEGRVAKLPIQSLYNWEYHNWKYEGSGWFTWFIGDISQFDRDFDRWSSFNESFYSEASFALYGKDAESFRSVLEKYKVNYLLLDESVINAGGSSETLYIPEIKEMLKNVGYLESQKFGFITIYEKDLKGLVFESPNYVQLENDAKYIQTNINYSKYNNYVNVKGETSYPFSDLDPRENVKIHLEDNRLVFENQQSNAKIFLPTKDKISENFNNKRGYALGYNCDLLKEGFVDKMWYSDSVRYIAKDGGVSCDFFAYQNLSYKNSYVLHIQGQNKKGRSLKVYLYNFASKKMDLEELLPEGDFDKYFIVYQKPNLEKQEGYSLNIETRSFGKVESENILSSIEFYPFDLSTIESIYKGGNSPKQIKNDLKILSSQKRGNDYLLTTKDIGVLFFNQGYDAGWQAFNINCQKGVVCSFKKVLPWFFTKPLPHFKVNSWANGWKVNSGEEKLLIVFWPQYLEWIGFGVLIISFYLVIFLRDKKIKK